MSNRSDQRDDTDIPETDFSGRVRGQYYDRAIQGTNVVLLESDAASVFKDSAVVSQALREYLQEHGAPPVVRLREMKVSRGMDGRATAQANACATRRAPMSL